MNRSSILREMQNNIYVNMSQFDSVVIEDQIIITRLTDNTEYSIKFRCQNFGDTYLINNIGVFVKLEGIEKQFESTLFEELKKYYDDQFTLGISVSEFNVSSAICDYEIRNEKDLLLLNTDLVYFINEIQNVIFDTISDVQSIANYISKFDYKDNLKVLVGGQFPVHNFKKIFLLFAGSQIGKYLEYKEGLLMQIESFPLRKPNRKDEAKIFLNNCNYLVNNLEMDRGLPT